MDDIRMEFKRREHYDKCHGKGAFRAQVDAECLRAKVIPITELTDDPEVIRQRAYIATRQSWEHYK